MRKEIDFLDNATNVYRTKNYIIKQKIYIKTDIFCNILLFSDDFYYLRTRQRDFAFDIVFRNRQVKDGYRLHSNSYSKRYITWWIIVLEHH